MTGPAPICMFCVHIRTGIACDAFPGGIPMEIFDGLVDHRKPVKGDRGIQWEQDRDTPTLDAQTYDRHFATGLPLTPVTTSPRR